MSDVDVMNLFRLDGRVALVTGGTMGLGQSMALGLAQAGATTVISSRHAEACDSCAAGIASQTGRPSVGMAADVTRWEDVERLVQSVVQRFGRLDVLINNAGRNIRHPIEDYPLEEYRDIMEVNVTGAWLCCRAAAPVLKRQRAGSVINLGSVMSAVALPDRSVYCSAKAAVIGMTKALALEWAPFGARCNAICPGPFLTEMNKPLLADPAKAQTVVGHTAFKRWGEMHEVRGAAVFLASDASSFVTGATLYVDGGWTAE